MKNKFLEKVAEQIADKHSRKLITAELESHLLDKKWAILKTRLFR